MRKFFARLLARILEPFIRFVDDIVSEGMELDRERNEKLALAVAQKEIDKR